MFNDNIKQKQQGFTMISKITYNKILISVLTTLSYVAFIFFNFDTMIETGFFDLDFSEDNIVLYSSFSFGLLAYIWYMLIDIVDWDELSVLALLFTVIPILNLIGFILTLVAIGVVIVVNLNKYAISKVVSTNKTDCNG
jgi:hypothetical protein